MDDNIQHHRMRPKRSSEIVHPFDPTEIKIDLKVSTIDNILKRLVHDEIDLMPDFQRSNEIWDDRARSRLIESLLIRIPIPAFYFDATNDELWSVIDGLQRLTTLKRFVVDKSLKLKGLEYLSELESLTYDEMPRKFQRRIEETLITTVLVQKGTPDNVKFNIFKRINTGGKPLSEQEIRHALNPENASRILQELAENVEFKTVWGTVSNIRMERNEIVLRVLGYYLIPINEAIKTPYEIFMDRAMKELNNLNNISASSLMTKFNANFSACKQIFGKYTFRKQFEASGRLNPRNKPLYETWMIVLSDCKIEDLETLISQKRKVNQLLIKLMNDKAFATSISSRKPHAILYRIEKVKELVREVLNDRSDINN